MKDDTIGVDVSKDSLDAHRLCDGASRRFANDKAGHKAFLRWFAEKPAERVVFEPTGPYHRAFERALGAASVPFAKVNPRQARRFAGDERLTVGDGKASRLGSDPIVAFSISRSDDGARLACKSVGARTMGEVAVMDASSGRITTLVDVNPELKGYALGKEHAITPTEALQLYTINNARIMGVEHERGSIEVGKLADLAVLSQDILSVPADAIRDTKAHLTVVGGKIVYRNGL